MPTKFIRTFILKDLSLIIPYAENITFVNIALRYHIRFWTKRSGAFTSLSIPTHGVVQQERGVQNCGEQEAFLQC